MKYQALGYANKIVDKLKTILKILHLEDTRADAELVERELKKGKIQFKILVVDNKTAFEKALSEYAPDIILANHSLPFFDSTEAIKIIRELGMKIPFIMVTATVSDEYAVEVMKAGADDYILKDRLHRLPQAVLNAIDEFNRENEREHTVYDQAHLAVIVNSSNDGIISKTMDGIISSWNISAEKLFGFSAVEAIGKNISIIIPPDRLQEEVEFMESIKRGESVQRFETVRLTKNETRVDVSLTISPLKDNNGKVIGAVKIVHDITERKQSEQILHDSREKYHSLFENNTDGILHTVTDGRILSANSAACTMFGMTEEEICAAGRFGLVDNTDPRLATAIEERQRTGKAKAELTLIRGNGDRFPAELTSVVYKNADGEQRTLMIVRDISERKNAEQLLKESEQFNKGVLASLQSHIAVIDNTGTVISVNKAWDDFAKANGPVNLSDTSIGSNYFTVCKDAIVSGENNVEQTLDGILSVFKKEKPSFQMEYPCHSPEEERWFILNVSPFGADDLKVVISHQNITERKTAENNLSTTSVELKKTLSDLNKILDSSLDVICTINAKGKFVNVSQASQKVWGYTPEELIGTKFIKLVYHEDADMTSKAAEKMYNGAHIPIFENRYVHKNGRVVPLLWSVNWDEKLQLMFCIAKDVTEKKGLEKAVENERDQFYDMFLKAPSAIGMLKGADHVFEMANPLYLQLIGKKDIIGKTVAEVLPEVVEQGFVGMLDHVYQTGESYIGTERLVKVDTEGNGAMTDLYIDFVYQAHKNGQGEIEGVFFFINDITEQVVSRKKTEKSEKKYRQIVETAQEGIWKIDEKCRTTFVNKKMCEILEYSEEEMMGKENYYFMDEGGKEKALNALKRRKKGIAENLEYSFISKNRRKVLTKVSANPIFDDMGNFKGSLGMVSDITEKKHLEDLLEKSNKLAAVGSWEIDVIMESVYWSDITKEIREVDKDYVPQLGDGISYFKEGIHRDTIGQKVNDCIKHGTPWDEELQIITFKGKEKWVRTIGEGDFLNGKCIKIHGSFQDITDRKNAEIKIRESEFQYRQIVETAQEGIWKIDENSRIIFANKKICEILEYSEEEMLGKEHLYFMDADGKEKALIALERRKKGISESFELGFISKSGKHILTKVSANPIFDDMGNFKGSLGMISDITEKKHLEDLLEKTNRLAAIGSWEIDVVKGTVFWSDITKEIREVDKDYAPILGEGMRYFRGTDKAVISQKVQECTEHGTPWDVELQSITFKGNYKWIRSIGQGEFLNGKCIRIHGSFQDIDKLKNAETKIRESEQKYRKLASELEIERTRLVTAQSVAKVGSWETDLQTWQVNWSEEMHRLYGTNANNFEPSYLNIQSFVHPEDREMIDKAFMDSLHKSSSSSLEHRIITVQGIEKWVEENWSVTTDEKGSPIVAIGTCQDITESKKEAEKVIRSEAKLKLAQHIAQVGSYEVDMLTKEQSWSDEFYRIVGINEDVIPSREAFVSFIHPDDRAMAISSMEGALSKYTDSSFQFRFIRKNGESGYALSEWKFEFDSHRNPLFIHGILRDLTKDKKAENERAKMMSDIVQRNSDLEQFSYMVSHNLRAPTANIIGFAEILGDETLTPQEQKELLQGLSESVTGLDTIIKDINTILQSNREVHEKKEIVIFSKLVNDIRLSIGNLIDKHRVHIICDFSEIDEIYSLKVYLYSIIYNLVSNSIKYSNPNESPLIEIKSKKEKGKIILTFKDNGLGINVKKHEDKIFGLYNRFHSHVEGKGMGLFMVKTQVESLGGKITIASELNKGTEFTIKFEI